MWWDTGHKIDPIINIIKLESYTEKIPYMLQEYIVFRKDCDAKFYLVTCQQNYRTIKRVRRIEKVDLIT